MGFFTWTLANRQPTFNRDGSYSARSKLSYDKYGAIVCPDNTLIKEPCYEGYGIFAGQDVYELVVDWNRAHLMEIPSIRGFVRWHCWDDVCESVMRAYAEDDQVALKAAIDKAAKTDPFIATEWKRTIGIYIGCDNNELLPYPIKIVDCKRPKPYDQLPPSISTQ